MFEHEERKVIEDIIKGNVIEITFSHALEQIMRLKQNTTINQQIKKNRN